MIKILAVVDKENTAIDRLAKGVSKYHDNLDYTVLPVHPKRPDPETLEAFQRLAKEADIVHMMYFRTAEMLRERYPFLKDKKQILDHYNPYSIKESDWNGYNAVVACNAEIFKNLGQITTAPLSHIPLTVDTDEWTFVRDWQPKRQAIMVAARIESKKGILEVAHACKEAGLKLVLVGSVSDPTYFHQVLNTGVVEYHQEISNEALKEKYHESLIHVCNSIDNFESGTLPVLEAMLSGCPVLTRLVGHVPELNNGENMLVNESGQDDVKNITKLLKTDLDKLKTMRERAWDTAKTRSNERRAYLYQKLYRSVLSPEKPVSIITPMYSDLSPEFIEGIKNQDYPNLEWIICNDDPKRERFTVPDIKMPIRYVDSPSRGYGLAKQRNLGIIEATGDIIVFCDQRMVMEPNAVSQLIKNLAPKRWVYGNKGVKKEWIENFSAVYREDLIKLGMFNERITAYGGMSQEMRSRAKLNSFNLEFVESAKAVPQGSSKNRFTKRDEIIKMKNILFKLDLQL